MALNKDIKKLLHSINTSGYYNVKRHKKHYKIYDRNNNLMMVVGSTPSDFKALNNIKSQLKRYLNIDYLPFFT